MWRANARRRMWAGVGALARAGIARLTYYLYIKKVDSMDSGQQQKSCDDPVRDGLALIKSQMPKTYADIQAQAAGPRGSATFALVRRSLKGEANCFYAIEGGHVVGTPFARSDVTDQIAGHMVGFGISFLVIWPLLDEGDHGAD